MHQSIAALLSERQSKSAGAVAVRYKENRATYRDMIWSDYGRLINELSFGLVALGLKPGECAAIMSNTSHLWIAADLAIISCAAVSVPVYPTSSSSDVEHILVNSEAKVLFVQNESLLKKALSVAGLAPDLQKIILMSAPGKGRSLSDLIAELSIADGLVIGLEELQELGRTLKFEKPQLIQERADNIKPDDLATIIYTSGTTGTPKGVMLLHSTILRVIEDLPPLVPVGESDIYLSLLPLSHVFERVCGEFFWLLNGSVCAFAEGLEFVPKNMAEVEPTMMLVVPRLLDKIYIKVNSGIEGASGRAQEVIRWSLAVGKEVFRHKVDGKALRVGLQAKHWVAEKIVLKKLRERIGRRLRLIVSGGAPATPPVIEFFNAIGITVIEGYGLTETAAPCNVNRYHRNKIGTVGPAIPSIEMKIADDGEILFKGPTVFNGYYKADDMTREAFTDGWFHTGDIGVVDADGYLKITDRKKDLIINSAGKNIAPQKIEGILKTIPLVSQAIVFGDKRKTLVALLTLDEQMTTEFARDRGFSFDEYSDLVALPELKKHLKKEIAQRSSALADYEQVRNIAILAGELSIENGELTATMKVKRNVLKQKYGDLIESLYHDDAVLVGA